jgi:hypothetical protein
MVGAVAVLGTVTWTAVVLRKRFGASSELSRARGLLHAIFGMQFLLGFGAYWARLESMKVGATSATVILTVAHTVLGAVLFAFSILIVLLCFRLVPGSREAAAAATPTQVPAR